MSCLVMWVWRHWHVMRHFIDLHTLISKRLKPEMLQCQIIYHYIWSLVSVRIIGFKIIVLDVMNVSILGCKFAIPENPTSRVSRNLMLFDFSNFAIIKLLWTNCKNLFLLQSPKKQMHRCVSLANTGYKIRNRNWKRVAWKNILQEIWLFEIRILEMVQEINLRTVNSLIMPYLQEIYTSENADESEYVCQIRYPPRWSPESHAPCE